MASFVVCGWLVPSRSVYHHRNKNGASTSVVVVVEDFVRDVLIGVGEQSNDCSQFGWLVAGSAQKKRKRKTCSPYRRVIGWLVQCWLACF